MTVCDACRVLEHARTDRNPPAALIADTIIDRLDGSLCTYRCNSCGSTWLRFRSNHLYRGAPPYWQTMHAAGSRQA